MAYIKEEKLASVKQLNCTGCGNALSIINPRAKYISCQYCGSVLDANSEEHQILMSMASPEQNQPFSFLKVGMIATFFDKKYQIIARTRWQQDYYEYWSEEGETGYSRELWVYDEWLLISEQRTYFYLVEDKDGFYISNEVIPEQPSLPDSSQHWSFMGEREQIIREYGAASVVYFEGESNYQIKVNDQINFAMYKHKGAAYAAEWRVDEGTNDIKEIEFFKEEPISRRKIMEAFEANEELAVMGEKGTFWQWLTYGSLGLVILFFVLMIGSCGNQEDKVFEQRFSLSEIDDEKGVISNSFKLDKGLHRLELVGKINQDNSESFILAYFLNENKDVINYLDGNFSVYSGFDDEGYWSEVNDKNDKIVKVKEAGTYYAKILADRDSTQTGAVLLTVKAGVKLTRYYVIGLIVALIFWFIFYSRMKHYLG